MEEQNLIIFADLTPLDLKKIMRDVYDYSKSYFGIAQKYTSRCRSCNASFERYSYKGLGWIDLMHAFLAIGFYVDGFITADKSFASLSNDPKFSNLQITIVS
jgi:hypothetical protein